jgi:hypothetical protein
MYVTLRAWRANEGGTTDLRDYSEIVPRDRTLFETKLQIYTAPRNGTYILLAVVVYKSSSSPKGIFAISHLFWRLMSPVTMIN